MTTRPIFLLAAGTLLLLLTACSTPARRAQQRAAAFRDLAPADQKLVLCGKVRTGFTKDAVYIAWGAPDWRFEDGKSKIPSETWLYERQLNATLPMGPSDQVYPPLMPCVTDFPRPLQPAFGYSAGSDVGFLTSPRAIITDVRFKRADFTENRLRRYEVRRGARHLTVTAQAEGHAVK